MDTLGRLMPSCEAYSRLPVSDAFNWRDCADELVRGDWYLVAFRSIVRPDADLDRLRAFDDRAHTEAASAPGFVHYFKGPLAPDGSCLSFCLWTSRAEARAAAGLPAHREAVALIAEMYSEYTLEFVSVRKKGRTRSFEFASYDALPHGGLPPIQPPTTIGLAAAQ